MIFFLPKSAEEGYIQSYIDFFQITKQDQGNLDDNEQEKSDPQLQKKWIYLADTLKLVRRFFPPLVLRSYPH